MDRKHTEDISANTTTTSVGTNYHKQAINLFRLRYILPSNEITP